MLLVGGNSHPELAKAVANKLLIPLVSAKTRRFIDQELNVQIEVNFQGQEVIIVQSTSNHDYLLELLFLADSAKKGGASHVTAIIPYFGYSRQDKPNNSSNFTPAGLIARLLEASGVDKVISLDLHSNEIDGFFNIEIKNLSPLPLLMTYLGELDNYTIVCPDAGCFKRIQTFADTLKLDLVVIEKRRISDGNCVMQKVKGEVSGKNCLLIDDIVASGKTLFEAGRLLIDQGAMSIKVFVTHGVFSGRSFEELNLNFFKEFYITDSIRQPQLPSKIKVIPISGLITGILKPTVK
jgi:ribose-phosphate pyrophosphokinase